MFLDFDTILRCRIVATLRMFADLGGPGGGSLSCGGGGSNHCCFFFLPFFPLTECSSECQECSNPVAAEESKCVCVCVLGRATGPALETDPHSTSLASSSHAHVESSVKKKTKKNCFLLKETAPHSALDLENNKKMRLLFAENHFSV